VPTWQRRRIRTTGFRMRRRDLLHPPQAYGTLNAPALRLSLDDDAIKPLGRRRISRPEKSINTSVEPADAIRPMYPPRPIGRLFGFAGTWHRFIATSRPHRTCFGPGGRPLLMSNVPGSRVSPPCSLPVTHGPVGQVPETRHRGRWNGSRRLCCPVPGVDRSGFVRRPPTGGSGASANPAPGRRRRREAASHHQRRSCSRRGR
jgi:hypothetical protein